MAGSAIYLGHVRLILNRSVIALQIVAIAGWAISFSLNPFIDRSTVSYVPVGVVVLAGLCVWKGLVKSLSLWRLGTFLYAILLATAFRVETAAMASQGTFFTTPLAILLSVGFAGVVPLRRDYTIIAASIWFILLAGPGRLPAGADLFLQYILIVCSIAVGILMNHAVIKNLRRMFQLKEDFRALSDTDPLTGISNRRSLLDHLEASLSRSAGNEMHLVMMDLDNFKIINDRFGHDVGDAVLRDFADALKCLPGDVCAGRLGGEEFAVFFSNGTRTAAKFTIDDLQNKIRENASLPTQYSFSAGGATFERHTTIEVILRHADEALYAAKANGKAQTIWHDESDAAPAAKSQGSTMQPTAAQPARQQAIPVTASTTPPVATTPLF